MLQLDSLEGRNADMSAEVREKIFISLLMQFMADFIMIMSIAQMLLCIIYYPRKASVSLMSNYNKIGDYVRSAYCKCRQLEDSEQLAKKQA